MSRVASSLRRCIACGRIACVCVADIPYRLLVAIAYAAQAIVIAETWGIYTRRDRRAGR